MARAAARLLKIRCLRRRLVAARQESHLGRIRAAVKIGPFAQWSEPQKIVSLDPWGHLVAEAFKKEIAEGVDIRPSIAVTKARLDLHEMQSAVAAGRLKADGDITLSSVVNDDAKAVATGEATKGGSFGVGLAVVISAGTSVWPPSSSVLGRSLAARLTSKSRSI